MQRENFEYCFFCKGYANIFGGIIDNWGEITKWRLVLKVRALQEKSSLQSQLTRSVLPLHRPDDGRTCPLSLVKGDILSCPHMLQEPSRDSGVVPLSCRG
jgi:hypothetical protein